MGDDLRPNALEERPVRIDRPSGVAANKGIDQANVKPRRGADDFPQMIDDETALLGIGVERVRIVAQRGDGDSILLDQVANLLNPIVIETRHIDVAYAGIAPVGVPRWPAHQLDAAKFLRGGELEHFSEGQVVKNGADKAQLHGKTCENRFGCTLER